MINKTIDYEPVCVLQVLIMKENVLPFSNSYVWIYNLL
jgi:hypothetical protein